MADFVIMAFVTGTLAGLLLAAMSYHVVPRGLSFMGIGISHGAFAGVAAGLALGVSPLALTYPVAILLALLITFATEKAFLREDALIGIYFSTFMAAGVVLLQFGGPGRKDVFGYLFGSLLALDQAAMIRIAVVCAVTLVLLLITMQEDMLIAQDAEMAQASGIRVLLRKMILAALLAVAIVTCIRVVGLILVEALLVIPAAAARRVARGYRSLFWGSLLVGVVSAAGGLALSLTWNLPPGATIVLVAAALYLILGWVAPALRRSPSKSAYNS